jgi:hypothetical protein
MSKWPILHFVFLPPYCSSVLLGPHVRRPKNINRQLLTTTHSHPSPCIIPSRCCRSWSRGRFRSRDRTSTDQQNAPSRSGESLAVKLQLHHVSNVVKHRELLESGDGRGRRITEASRRARSMLGCSTIRLLASPPSSHPHASRVNVDGGKTLEESLSPGETITAASAGLLGL